VATVDGERRRYAYDLAGQLVTAATAAGTYAFAYDANGRLVREVSPGSTVAYAYDGAGRLVERREAGGQVTRYAYDGAGRRVLEERGALRRTWRWDELGRLAGIEARGPGRAGAHAVGVEVDAVGELAAVDGAAVLWDPGLAQTCPAWLDGRAVIGDGWWLALAGAGAVAWLAPDWPGTGAGGARDPWDAAAGTGGALPPPEPGVRLGRRGALEFAGAVWLRGRPYDPATRSFVAPDPLLPVPGTASAANRYHYAGNNPVGLRGPRARDLGC
jgi:RHS repeat-associated protein